MSERRGGARRLDPAPPNPVALAGGRAAPAPAYAPPELAVVVPVLNERGNIVELVTRLHEALRGVRWEVVFVDDDSRDGTSELLAALARSRPNVRHLLRIGRRGLASACIEGMLASSAPFIAVMDADLQHDESALPAMLAALRGADDLDVVVGTRFAPGGSVGEFGAGRLRMSRIASRLSRMVLRAHLSDPMSGFFMLRRAFLEETVRDLSRHGFKILLDLFASARREVRFAEIPYRFRARRRGRVARSAASGPPAAGEARSGARGLMGRTARRHLLAILFGGTGSLHDRIKEIDRTLSPKVRGWIHGAGLAFDPLPIKKYPTFMDSDGDALRADWTSIGNDIRAAMLRPDVRNTERSEEAGADDGHTLKSRAAI